MAKSRAQRKAERRAREAEARAKGEQDESQAQHDTQVPKSGDIAEVEAVEAGMGAGATEKDLEAPDAKGLSSKQERREEKRKKKQTEKNQKAEQKKQEEQQLSKRQKQAQGQRKRGGLIGFLGSCVAELKRVQWPDRDTLFQATAVTVVFVFIAALYLGIIDLAANWLVQRIL